MKKLLLLALAAVLLLTSLASCSRRGAYEDVLESQKEAASKEILLHAMKIVNSDITFSKQL